MKNHGHWAPGVLVLAGMLLYGCSHQDFSSLSVPLTDMYQAGKPYIPKDPEAEAIARAQRMAKVLEQSKSSAPSRDYHVGPEDVLEIGVLALEEPGKVSKILLTIQSDGGINLPWVGIVKVGGMSLREVETQVKASLEGRFIKNPQVTAAVSLFRGAPVIITGAVRKPGVYYLRNDTSTILELLVEADGLSPEAGSQMLLIKGSDTNAAVLASAIVQAARSNATEVVSEGTTNAVTNAVAGTIPVPEEFLVTNSDNVVVIDLRQLIDEGDVRLNLRVRSGDILNIPPRIREFFYVLGYVNRPGAYDIDRKNPPGALQAVAMAGGLTATARAENSCLLRQGTNGMQVITVDLTKIMRGVRPPFDVAPGDTLVVGSSFVARLSEFVRPSVGVSAGAAVGFP